MNTSPPLQDLQSHQHKSCSSMYATSSAALQQPPVQGASPPGARPAPYHSKSRCDRIGPCAAHRRAPPRQSHAAILRPLALPDPVTHLAAKAPRHPRLVQSCPRRVRPGAATPRPPSAPLLGSGPHSGANPFSTPLQCSSLTNQYGMKYSKLSLNGKKAESRLLKAALSRPVLSFKGRGIRR